ncbi:lipoprotein [Spiroplasma endosymbiont of Anurida maritima]|uniref:lipoprotein n=1 Tax=Spiroplasma endosymbiont of Anurida maritima TaxID=2967972 RepID=UPI0036D2269A
MKKLLSILGSLGIVGMAAATVVACSTIADEAVSEPPRDEQVVRVSDLAKEIQQETAVLMQQKAEKYEPSTAILNMLADEYNKGENSGFPHKIDASLLEAFERDINTSLRNDFTEMGAKFQAMGKYANILNGFASSDIIKGLSLAVVDLNELDLEALVLAKDFSWSR